MSNSIIITCPHCMRTVHLISSKVEVKINSAWHEPRCITCKGFDHTTEQHNDYEDARAIAS